MRLKRVCQIPLREQALPSPLRRDGVALLQVPYLRNAGFTFEP